MDKQQQLLDLEKQKVAAAALLISHSQAAATASLNNNTVKSVATTNVKPVTTTNTASAATAATTASTMNAVQSLNLAAQTIFQNLSAEKHQQLLHQKQVALQQLLQKQQVAAQLKKEALEAVTSITAANEPDIQITGVTRQSKSNVTSQSINMANQITRSITSGNNNLTNTSSRFSVNKPVSSLANGTTAPFSSGSSSSPSTAKMKGKGSMRVRTKKDVSTFGENSDDEDEEMEVAGVNLQVFHYVKHDVNYDRF